MTYTERAQQLRPIIEKAAQSLDDKTALEAVELFPIWIADKDYSTGDRCREGELLYKCVQTHHSQSDWQPSVTPALWTRVDDPGEEWPEWRRPTGAQDAYSSGAKVSHNDKHWISSVDANVWEPGVYGWELMN